MKASFLLGFTAILLFANCHAPKSSLQPFQTWRIEPPAGERYCQINLDGETVIPNGRVIKPMGNTVRIAPRTLTAWHFRPTAP